MIHNVSDTNSDSDYDLNKEYSDEEMNDEEMDNEEVETSIFDTSVEEENENERPLVNLSNKNKDYFDELKDEFYAQTLQAILDRGKSTFSQEDEQTSVKVIEMVIKIVDEVFGKAFQDFEDYKSLLNS